MFIDLEKLPKPNKLSENFHWVTPEPYDIKNSNDFTELATQQNGNYVMQLVADDSDIYTMFGYILPENVTAALMDWKFKVDVREPRGPFEIQVPVNTKGHVIDSGRIRLEEATNYTFSYSSVINILRFAFIDLSAPIDLSTDVSPEENPSAAQSGIHYKEPGELFIDIYAKVLGYYTS